MTLLAEDIIQEQLDQQLDGDRTVVLANPDDAAYILIVNPDGTTIYEAAAEDENSGMWLFIENALAPFASDANSQDVPAMPLVPNELQFPQAVAEPVRTESHIAWQIIGGMAVAGLAAVGLSRERDDSQPHDNYDDSENLATSQPAFPKPHALVTRYSVAKNPTATEPEPTPQADSQIQPEQNTTDLSVTENVLTQFDAFQQDVSRDANQTDTHYIYSDTTPDLLDDNPALWQHIV